MTGIIIILFLGFFGIILVAFGVGFKVMETRQRLRVTQVLKTVSSGGTSTETTALPTANLELAPESAAITPLVAKFAPLRSLEAAIRGAALGWRVEGVLVGMVCLAAVGGFAGSRFNVLMFPWLSGLGLALALGMAPVWYVYQKRTKRLAEFERQFPEALDFVSRSVRAGHALSISLELLANESEAPLGPEFRRLTNELNLGTPFDVGLRNLADRVPLIDVRFFVSAVLLQRETGGNLTEILSSLATLIRSRFRLKGQVKAMSSQGRITALVLTLLPIFLAMALMVISPEYLKGMARDPVGRYMILGAVLGQIVGYVIMKRIVNIKV
ncbi:MAG: type II secretion system F family protein [Bryobacteraceae bacterium]|nr:type II secretion system F family protein [Bryobacteraceae bacterium]